CCDERNTNWRRDSTFEDLFHKIDENITVCVVPKDKLTGSLQTHENWTKDFISANLFKKFDDYTTELFPSKIDVFRGERTGWNPMFIISEEDVINSAIEEDFLIPYLKDSSELDTIDFSGNLNHYLFVCDKPIDELRRDFQGAYNWIRRFENLPNKNHTKTISEANANHRPFWYSLRPKSANIVTSINPYERFFFSFSENSFIPDQRLIVLNAKNKNELQIISALLNSIITFLSIEMRGTARNLGVLDLNANDFKRLRVLNPDLLNQQHTIEIL